MVTQCKTFVNFSTMHSFSFFAANKFFKTKKNKRKARKADKMVVADDLRQVPKVLKQLSRLEVVLNHF